MDNLKIKASKYTPAINFDAENNLLDIKGECYPENISKFSIPIFSWMDEYLKQVSTQAVIVNVELTYFNSSTSRMLLDFFLKLEDSGKNITVNWLYDEDNDSAEEFGEEFQEDLDSLPFNLVVKEE